MRIKLIINTSYIELNRRRYDKGVMTRSSMNRIMRVVSALPDELKSFEVENDLSVTVYVFSETKRAKQPVEHIPSDRFDALKSAPVSDCVASAPVTFEYELDEVECMSCRELCSIDSVVDGICCECRAQQMEEIEETPLCDCCGGTGELIEWRFGFSGGYEVFKPCPMCG